MLALCSLDSYRFSVGASWNVKRRWMIIVLGCVLTGRWASIAPARGDEPRIEPLPPAAQQTTLAPTKAVDPAPFNAVPISKPIGAITTAVSPPVGDLPADVAAGHFAAANGPHDQAGRHFHEMMYFWAATNLSHHPLRFEQAYVERYGYNYGLLQPVFSGVQFYGDVALLPAKWVTVGPCRSIYTLGSGRPGSYGTRNPHPCK